MSRNEIDKKILNTIYRLKDNCEFEVDENGLVVVLTKYNSFGHRFFRKIRKSLPKYHRMELDQYSSFVFLQINGQNTVSQIANNIINNFNTEDAKNHTVERLLMYLSYLEYNMEVIIKNEEIEV